MSTAELKQKLHDYIETAEEKKLQAIFTMVEDEIVPAYNYLDDEDFMKELVRRTKDLESGKEKGLSWDEVKTKAMKTIKQAK